MCSALPTVAIFLFLLTLVGFEIVIRATSAVSRFSDRELSGGYSLNWRDSVD